MKNSPKKKTLKSLLAATRRVLCVEFCMLKFMLPDTPLCVTHTESRAEQHRAAQSRAEHTGHFLLRSVCFSSHPAEREVRTECALGESVVASWMPAHARKCLRERESESFLCSALALAWRVGFCHCPGRALGGGGWASNAARHVQHFLLSSRAVSLVAGILVTKLAGPFSYLACLEICRSLHLVHEI